MFVFTVPQFDIGKQQGIFGDMVFLELFKNICGGREKGDEEKQFQHKTDSMPLQSQGKKRSRRIPPRRASTSSCRNGALSKQSAEGISSEEGWIPPPVDGKWWMEPYNKLYIPEYKVKGKRDSAQRGPGTKSRGTGPRSTVPRSVMRDFIQRGGDRCASKSTKVNPPQQACSGTDGISEMSTTKPIKESGAVSHAPSSPKPTQAPSIHRTAVRPKLVRNAAAYEIPKRVQSIGKTPSSLSQLPQYFPDEEIIAPRRAQPRKSPRHNRRSKRRSIGSSSIKSENLGSISEDRENETREWMEEEKSRLLIERSRWLILVHGSEDLDDRHRDRKDLGVHYKLEDARRELALVEEKLAKLKERMAADDDVNVHNIGQ